MKYEDLQKSNLKTIKRFCPEIQEILDKVITDFYITYINKNKFKVEPEFPYTEMDEMMLIFSVLRAAAELKYNLRWKGFITYGENKEFVYAGKM